MSPVITEKDAAEACQFAIEEAVAQERAKIAEIIKSMEGHFWYPMAEKNLKELRERVGL